jgi:hypothetical protein
MAPLPTPTRTTQTEAEYRRRARNLIHQCRRHLSLTPTEVLDYRQFVGWLITRKSTFSRPTWRQYKASVCHVLEIEADQRGNPIAQEALESLLPIDVEGCVKRTKKTSGSKLKRFPIKDFHQAIKRIERSSSPWAQDLKRWMVAGMITGLRPMEWSTAELKSSGNGVIELVVQNAKATNSRAHGPTRTLFLDGLTQDERDIVAEHIERANLWHHADQYTSFYQGCAGALARTCRYLWPKRQQFPTLYSLRHQFSADAKASGLTREELAALMGHAVDTTAGRHYGKKSAGHSLIMVRPDPKEVAKIRQAYRVVAPQPKLRASYKPAEEQH